MSCASGSKDWLPKALTGWASLPKPVLDYSVNKTENSGSERSLSVLKDAGHVTGGILLLLEEDQLPGVLCVCVRVKDRDRQRQDAGAVAHCFNPGTREMEASRSL